jgi:uncharacterized protein (DUF1330 family)
MRRASATANSARRRASAASGLSHSSIGYAWRLASAVHAHGGRVIALGNFREAVTGSIEPRTVPILVEWSSKEAFDGYCTEPVLQDLHPHRVSGTSNYVWHLFDKLDDLRPILRGATLARRTSTLAMARDRASSARCGRSAASTVKR